MVRVEGNERISPCFGSRNFQKAKTGAGGRTRTDTVLLPRDFESRASANFATPADFKNIYEKCIPNDEFVKHT